MHQRCGQAFAGSHLCHVAEYERATPTITPPATGAWLDASGFATPEGGVLETRLAAVNVGRWTARAVVGPGTSCDS